MYYDNNTIIYFNGEFVKASEAKIDLYSQSLHYGYAVFEGIRAYELGKTGTRIFKAREHYNRLRRSAEFVQIPFKYSTEELIELSYELLRRNNFLNAYVRPLVFCSANMSLIKAKESYLTIQAWDWNYFQSNKLRLMTSTYTRPNPTAFHMEAKVSGHYVNSILACQQAKDKGFDEALLLDVNGFVAEGPGANVFFEKEGTLYTPPKGNILPGITRATVIEICYELSIPVVEKLFTPSEMKEADAAFYCGTAAEVVELESLDDVPFKIQWENSLSHVIQKAYKKLVLGKSFAELRAVASRLLRHESGNIEPAHRVQKNMFMTDQVLRTGNFQFLK